MDPRDLEPLTPNHFLLGRACPNVPPDIITDAHVTSRKKWKQSQAIIDAFWGRLRKEYIPTLMQIKKWETKDRNLVVGDDVLIADPSAPRGHWPIGRVVQANQAPDWVVRRVTIKTKTGEDERPVARICLLEASTDAQATKNG